jgi:oligopeptide transport system ATP-binding protein
MPPLLEVKGLHTEFRTGAGLVRAVDGVSYTVHPGETVAIVGESGSGKSVGAMSILRLIPDPPGRITQGQILFAGRDLLTLSDEEMREVRGSEIGMIFQEPMTSLNPVLTIGRQITETLQQHRGADRATADRRAVELLTLVGIADPERRLRQYPHQLSGGMRQRIMIAIALTCEPRLIIADEPTTALDVTIQAQILELMAELTRRLNVALIIITHGERGLSRAASPLHDGPVALGAATRPAASGPARSGRWPAARPRPPRRRLRVPTALPVRRRGLRRIATDPRGDRCGRPSVGLLPPQ